MNVFSQCLIDSNIETNDKHHVPYPRFGLYTFLTASPKEEHKNIKKEMMTHIPYYFISK
jgi:hypothetical protein